MNAFSSSTVSFGIVVGDMSKSLAFYKNAVGLKETEGFDVPPAMGGDSGLSDGKPFHVHVLMAGDDPTATNVKLMQFPGTPSARPDNQFIHSTLGIRYLTFMVTDIDAAVARARAAGVAPLAKGPIELPASVAEGIYLACLRDPDGNIVELVGPRTAKR